MAQKISLTSTTLVDGAYTPNTGLAISDWRFIKLSDSTVVTFTGFSESPAGSGNYEFWGFNVPTYASQHTTSYKDYIEVLAQINVSGSWVTQTGFGVITVYADDRQPVGQGYVDGRLDRGFVEDVNPETYYIDTIYGKIHYAPEVITAGLPTILQDEDLVHKKYLVDYLDTTGGGFVTISGTQTITGDKTFTGTETFDVGVKSKGFVIKQQSNPVNGGIEAMTVSYRSTNKPQVEFGASDINSDGTSTFANAKIKTSSSLYINGNPLNNNYVWKKWCLDNFQPLVNPTTWVPNMVIVDSTYTSPPSESGVDQFYSNITDAITGITAYTTLDGTNVWTIVVREAKNTTGYVETVDVPDYLNIVGEGQVYIIGQLTRSGASSVITSKIQNLHIITARVTDSMAVDRFEMINCVIEAIGGTGNVVLTKSKLRDCGFYITSGSITSGNNNKIINCFGNKAVTWGGNDKVYGYNYVEGDTYGSIG